MKSCNICNRCNSGRVNHVITWNDNQYYLCDACFYPYIEINNLCFELNFHYLNNHFRSVNHLDLITEDGKLNSVMLNKEE